LRAGAHGEREACAEHRHRNARQVGVLEREADRSSARLSGGRDGQCERDAQGEPDKSPAQGGEIDSLKRQLSEMQKRLDRLTDTEAGET